jgi:hypothetical protein
MNHGLVKSGLFNMNVLQLTQDKPYNVVLFYRFRSLYSYKVTELQGREHSKNTLELLENAQKGQNNLHGSYIL